MLTQIAWYVKELTALIGNGIVVQFFVSLTVCAYIMLDSIPVDNWREWVIAEDLFTAAFVDLIICGSCMLYTVGKLDGFAVTALILAALLLLEENFLDWRKPRSYYEKDVEEKEKELDKFN